MCSFQIGPVLVDACLCLCLCLHLHLGLFGVYMATDTDTWRHPPKRYDSDRIHWARRADELEHTVRELKTKLAHNEESNFFNRD